MKIAFVGLGNMGLPMACNLVKAGHTVLGSDLNQDALGAFKSEGGTPVTELSALENADVYITMLQTGEQVSRVLEGESGLFSLANQGALFIDCSSIDVQTSKAVQDKAKNLGFLSVDAPVSGGVPGATAATLTIMVGGSDESFASAKSILDCMGKNVVHAGSNGCGQAAKICNNMILGISMTAVSEAFVLGEKLGLKPDVLFAISSQSSGQCWSMTSYCPVPNLVDNAPSNNDYKPGFAAPMMLKDLRLSQKAAADVEASTPLGEHATKLYEDFIERGGQDLDFSAIIKMFEE